MDKDEQQVLADSFWVWLIGAALVHYFAGFGWISGILYALAAMAFFGSIKIGMRKARVEKLVDKEIEQLERMQRDADATLESSALMLDGFAKDFDESNPEMAARLREIAAEARD